MSVVTVVARGDSRADRARSVDTTLLAGAVACAGVCLLTIVAPFEARQGLVRLPGQTVSTVELALLAVFGAWTFALVAARSFPDWRWPLSAPWIAWLGASLIAALAAPAERLNAVHMVSRIAIAFGVFLLTASGISSTERLRTTLLASAIAGAIVSALVVAEYLAMPGVLELLRTFRPSVAGVGAQVRAGGPFQYPTIASMYLEIVFALVLGLLAAAIDQYRYVIGIVIVGLLALFAEAIILTFTRAGLITMAASLVVVGTARVWRTGFDRAARAIAIVAAIVTMQFFASRSVEAVRLRLTTEGQDAWYRATMKVPATISVPTGGTARIRVTLTNDGRVTWDPAADRPFRLAYHWLLPDSDQVVAWEGARTEFPAPVPPGTSVTLDARVDAPRYPGTYRLVWDIEQVDQLWFSAEPDAEVSITRAIVAGPASLNTPPIRLSAYPTRAVRPGRLRLWRAAAQMVAAHPLSGVGPDNFRLTYGQYASIAYPDTRMHSNNMYLEVLAGAGAIGAIAFGWFCWRAARVFVAAALRPASRRLATYGAGIAAAGAAVALHGVVDSFLSFTATYILIAITLGLAVSCGRLSTDDAHRV